MLFTGDAGQGERNIRRWIIENDWLDAIVALPLNLFYNTGIATYVWLLSNRKPEHRRGRVQLIDASGWFKPLRKNLGKKNCELSADDIGRICDTYRAFQESEQSKLFANQAFGYWKITVERPLQLHSQLTPRAVESLRCASGDEDLRGALYDHLGEPLFENFASVRHSLETLLHDWGASEAEDESEDGGARKTLPEKKKKKLLDARTWERDARLVEAATALRHTLGEELFEDHNVFRAKIAAALDKLGIRLGAADLKVLLRAVSWRGETAPPVIAKVHKPGKAEPDPLRGLYLLPAPRFGSGAGGEGSVVEYEPDPDLRDTEQVPLLEEGGIEAFLRREVLPYTPDAWLDESKTQIGYEISFTRHFYKPQPLRTLNEIRTDILALEKETEGLLEGLLR